jgi:hypothetical protein
MDFTIFYKSLIENDSEWAKLPEFDLFISTFDNSDRVKHNFSKVSARHKHWLLTPHHKIDEATEPKNGTKFKYNIFNDDDFIVRYFEEIKPNLFDGISICIDITGFIRPFLIFLIRYLHSKGYKSFHAIYTEPHQYLNSEDTEFSGFVDFVRPIPGCASIDLLPVSTDDVLIIAAGYDDKLISAVANDKKYCNMKYQIFGLPSLQPDMYQENVLKVFNARESLGNDVITLYSPAFDPFVTSQILKETIDAYLLKKKVNFYLSPLSTKPQVLGFILYYLYEGHDKSINLIFPYSKYYSINTCKGHKKTWHYTLELP